MIYLFRYLDVSSCRIEASGSYALAEMIRNSSSIEILNIGFNRLQSNGGFIIFSALKNNTILKKLDVSGNLLKPSFLGEGIDDMTSSLKILSIGQNNIGDKGVIALMKSLGNNTNIEQLFLNLYNDITDVGASILANGLILSASTSIKLLDLSGNRIMDLGAEALAGSLLHRNQNNLPFVNVKLSGNKISTQWLHAIAKIGVEQDTRNRSDSQVINNAEL